MRTYQCLDYAIIKLIKFAIISQNSFYTNFFYLKLTLMVYLVSEYLHSVISLVVQNVCVTFLGSYDITNPKSSWVGFVIKFSNEFCG